MALSFAVATSPIQHVTAKLLALHHDYTEKTVFLNTHEYLLGQHDQKLITLKTNV